MSNIGIDVGSTYTKYCIMEGDSIVKLYSEKTPVMQKEYFEKVRYNLLKEYLNLSITSCGYGKKNACGGNSINELTALAKGVNYMAPDAEIILDIGGQDTKVITQKNGNLQKFFINEKCAAGSGMFLSSTLQLLEKRFEDIDLTGLKEPEVDLVTICAVFAQSEIVRLIADNVPADVIINAVIWHILIQSKTLLSKIATGSNGILLTGGLSSIKGIDRYASLALNKRCCVEQNGAYFSAIGCALDRNTGKG